MPSLPRIFSSVQSASIPMPPTIDLTTDHSSLMDTDISQQQELLKLIDRLKTFGPERELDIPQLVVCGDQSSGKSSVLECISGIPFPSKDTLCTRFPVEFTMKFSPDGSRTLSASIIPDPNRLQEEQNMLKAYNISQKTHEQLADMISDASAVLGLSDAGPRFARDILRVEVLGPDFTNLSMVDLPGIFRWSDANNQDDCEFVESLVTEYMEREGTIILAIISAKNDFYNQIVVQHAKKRDKSGERTFAIITRPDGVDDSPALAEQFLGLAKNNKRFPCSGWHVIRARKATERQMSEEEFNKVTEAFYQTGVWAKLDDTQKGVLHLRQRLTKRLTNHIMQSVEPLKNQILSLIATYEEELYQLSSQKTITANRKELRNISTQFTKLVEAATRGAYTDSFFRKRVGADIQSDSNRLRSAIERRITDFRVSMQGVTDSYESSSAGFSLDDTVREALRVTPEDLIDDIIDRLDGLGAMQGQFSMDLLNELFREQCEPWSDQAQDLANGVMNIIEGCLQEVLMHVHGPMDCTALWEQVVRPNLQQERASLCSFVASKIPLHSRINLDQKLANRVEVARRNYIRGLINKYSSPLYNATPPKHQPKNKRESVVLTGDVAAAYDIHRCNAEEMVLCLNTHYDQQLGKFLDNLDLCAFDDAILQKLPNIFNSNTVEDLDDDVLKALSTEDPETNVRKKDLEKKARELRAILSDFQKLATRHIPATTYPIREPSTTPKNKKGRKREAISPLQQRSAKR